MPISRIPILAFVTGLSLCVSAVADSPNKPDKPDKQEKFKPSAPLPALNVKWPTTTTPTSTQTFTTANTASGLYKGAVNMKLLVLSGEGTEPGFAALKFYLDYLNLPYEAVVMSQALVLPPLVDPASGRGNYQGIILATGGLGYSHPTSGWISALSTADWTRMDDYMRSHGVRVASYYTFPEARYGMTYVSAMATSAAAPASLAFASASSTIFPYLVRTNPLQVAEAYLYLAAAAPAVGETTTPILTIGSGIAGVTHTKADGREFMALTFDNNPYLMHSLALNYGIFNWVTKGIFVGERRIYLTPQNDDFFLPNDLFVASITACRPTGFSVDPTYDPSAQCPTDRMDGGDLLALDDWQKAWRAKAQTRDFRVTHAFNGFGATPEGGSPNKDSLLTQLRSSKDSFFWVNHTWDHENLDCYNPVPNSGICAAATFAQSQSQLTQNIAMAKTLSLPNDSTSVVTPNISGLSNMNFLLAAQDAGVKYLVSDTSRPQWMPTKPNTGVSSPSVPSILYIPRRATNVYYNTKSGRVGANGSLPDEYNYFYGPNGIFRLPGGAPFFSTNQTYAQIVDRESTTYLGYMLRYETYPLMFHQSNFIRFGGTNSLFTDVMTATFDKFMKISNLPVASLSQTALGKKMEDRMAFNAAGVQATYNPGSGITFTSQGAASIPVTGICAAGCLSYGGQNISSIPISAGGTVSVPLF